MKDLDTPSIIVQSDALSIEVQTQQRMAEARNAVKRQAERQAAYDAWIDPEEMKKRKAASDKTAAASLAYLKATLPQEDEVIIPDPLPDEFKGQAMSYIKRTLAHRHNVVPRPPIIMGQQQLYELQYKAELAQADALATSRAVIEKHTHKLSDEAFDKTSCTRGAAPLKIIEQPEPVVTPEVKLSWVKKLREKWRGSK